MQNFEKDLAEHLKTQKPMTVSSVINGQVSNPNWQASVWRKDKPCIVTNCHGQRVAEFVMYYEATLACVAVNNFKALFDLAEEYVTHCNETSSKHRKQMELLLKKIRKEGNF